MSEKQLEKLALSTLKKIRMALEARDYYSAQRAIDDLINKVGKRNKTVEINTAIPSQIFELGTVE